VSNGAAIAPRAGYGMLRMGAPGVARYRSRMDDIDEFLAFRRLAEPLIAHLRLDHDAREAVTAEMWRERATLTRWLLLRDDADERAHLAAGRSGGH
jgi:hypothetical protein